EPSNESIKDVLKATGGTVYAHAGTLFNPMVKFEEEGKGSHLFNEEWHVLDQMMLSAGLVTSKSKGWEYVPKSASTFSKDWMFEQEGKYAGSPLRTYAGNKYLGGYSDHLPIYLKLYWKK
ncbi:MAG: endonuclease/exonuclease/phosphatase family protein, partial [Bacteroidia bacterium]|nr:endonuclease/exonuclease/phosphatase family protein [Bacteroidia bacterium]